ncbi:Protein translocase subunit, partial [Frankliniella fusca]
DQEEKLAKLIGAAKKKLSRVSSGQTESPGESESLKDLQEIMKKIREAMNNKSLSRAKKMQIISLLPDSWGVKRIQKEFNVSKALIRKAKKLTTEQGLMPDPPLRSGRPVPNETKDKVIEWYEDEENSRMLPGKKDYVIIRENNSNKGTFSVYHRKTFPCKKQVQKRLVLCNLKELYLSFKEKHSELKIGFSKFCELRPKYCVLAGASGTHSVCVCAIHQNFKLKVDSAALEVNKKILDYKEVLQLVLCDDPGEPCYTGCCSACPGIPALRNVLELAFESRQQDNIEFKQWTSVDRCAFETILQTKEVFIDSFLEDIPVVLLHHFIAKSQSQFYRDLKLNLKDGECIVVGDFAENYTPVYQDAIQKIHWSNIQVTLHPFVSYFRENGEEKCLSFVIISDTEDHQNEEVFTFLHSYIPFLKEHVPNLKHIYYFSDGAASQYKNRKNVTNLRMHFDDFGLTAEWHYFATSHGKGPCDGLGGTLKRHAARESLQKIKNQEKVTDAPSFFRWAEKKFMKKDEEKVGGGDDEQEEHAELEQEIEQEKEAREKKTKVHVCYVSSENINMIKEKYRQRFSTCPAVDGIKSCHAVIPLSSNTVFFKQYSSSNNGFYSYFGPKNEVNFCDIYGFVTVHHENDWRVGFVEERFENELEVEITLLEKINNTHHKIPQENRLNVKKKLEEIIKIVNVEVQDNLVFKLRRDGVPKFVGKEKQKTKSQTKRSI